MRRTVWSVERFVNVFTPGHYFLTSQDALCVSVLIE